MAFDPNAPATNNNAYNDIAQIREDLNQLRGMEFGTSFPANPRNCQWFCKTDDGTAGKVYQRNKDNTAWIFQFDLAYPVQDHVNKNITPSIAVHGIQQGTGNGLDADKVDGYDAVDLNKNLENIVNNGSFETWLNDTSSPPNGWVVTDGTVSRSTDKTRGAYAAVLTRSGAFPAFLYHDVTDYERLKNVTVILSAKVKCSVASRARIQINDGVTTTSSSYHSGGGTWETLSVFATVDVAATQLRVQLKIENNTGNATFDEVVLREGNLLSSFAPAFVDSLPVQANFWADGSIVVSGGPFTHAVNTSQRYNTVSYQSGAGTFYQTCLLKNGSYDLHILGVVETGAGSIQWKLNDITIGNTDFWGGGTTYNVIKTISAFSVPFDGLHSLKGIANSTVKLTKFWIVPS